MNHKSNLIRFNDLLIKTVNSEKMYFNVGRIFESEIKSSFRQEIRVAERSFQVYRC